MDEKSILSEVTTLKYTVYNKQYKFLHKYSLRMCARIIF